MLVYFSWTRRSIGRKKRRKVRDRSGEKRIFLDELARVPNDALKVFTDGSSLGNPGPGGAGYYMYADIVGPILYLSHHIPDTTNNIAELTALHLAITKLTHQISRYTREQRFPVFFFIDNQYTIKAAEGTIRCRKNRTLVEAACSAVAGLGRLTDIHFRWVPGHAGILQNEIADWLAKRGAAGQTTDRPPPHTVIEKLRKACGDDPGTSRHSPERKHDSNRPNHDDDDLSLIQDGLDLADDLDDASDSDLNGFEWDHRVEVRGAGVDLGGLPATGTHDRQTDRNTIFPDNDKNDYRTRAHSHSTPTHAPTSAIYTAQTTARWTRLMTEHTTCHQTQITTRTTATYAN